VLLKALMVARKLSLDDARTWINKELTGYKADDSAPQYRIIKADIQVLNPYHGWVPLTWQVPHDQDRFSTCQLGQPIGELENMVRDSDGVTTFSFDSVTENHLMRSMEVPLRPVKRVNNTKIVGIINAVRTQVANWCMDLEQNGIVGENLTFSAKEKEAASHINNSTFHFYNVETAQVQQGTTGSTQSISVTNPNAEALGDIMRQLSEQLAELALKPPQQAQVQADIETVQCQLRSPSPSRVILNECIRSVTNILEGYTGSVLATMMLHKLSGVSF
jgi:hypothetical protein